MTLPIREQVLQYIKSKFEAVTSVGGETNLTWERVVRAPLSDADRKLKTCVSLMEGRERVSEKTLVTDCLLDFSVEFEVRTYIGEDPATFLNLVLCDVRKTMMEDRQCGGLCLHVQEVANETDITSGSDRMVGGIVFFTITYRHMTGDPTRALGE